MNLGTVCVDFDGVLNTYDGWRGEDELFEMRPGAGAFLSALCANYRVVIFTTRPADKVWAWLQKYYMDSYVDEVTSVKPPAVAYIDDRAVRFDGDFNATFSEVVDFKAHWENREAPQAHDIRAAITVTVLNGLLAGGAGQHEVTANCDRAMAYADALLRRL